MSGKITVCPECDSAQIYRRSIRNGGDGPEGLYRCEKCEWVGDEPKKRENERSNEGSAGNSEYGKALLDMDPSEFP